MIVFIFLTLVFSTSVKAECKSTDSPWTWACVKDKCVKQETSSHVGQVELDTCKLTCGPSSMLFPKPSGTATFGSKTVSFIVPFVSLAAVECETGPCSSETTQMVNNAFNRFQDLLQQSYVHHSQDKNSIDSVSCVFEANQRKMKVYIRLQDNYHRLTLDTDEGYSLNVTATDSVIQVSIEAATFFGARHGFESVSQLTAYLRSHNSMQIVSPVRIVNDKPAYKYRGVLLDTSRNFYSVDNIKNLVKALSFSKMNTLHWHITDSQSFPIEIKSVPQLQRYGAYSPSKTYSQKDVREIVDMAAMYGVRVLPEFDQPAHCGEGWQFGPKAGLGNLAVCVNRQPWQKYCVEPPCGQLNPTNPKLYGVLGKIYKEYFQMFKPDIFHAGGDEININCWNTTKEITDWMHAKLGGVGETEFMDMWKMFLDTSSQKIYEANNGKQLPLILWTSKMTSPKYVTKYMDPSKHIIQLWTQSTDKELANVIEKGFRTIFSTYDTLYLDCGYGNWLVEGNNWCSPYKDWKLLYNNDPVAILEKFGVNVTESIKASVLGQEAAMWSEQVDDSSSEGKIWPRAAALAERLWSNPSHDWRAAEYRLIYHRERLVERGVKADALQPLWCKQNAGNCFYDPTIKQEHFK